MERPHLSVIRGFHIDPPLWTFDDTEDLIRSARHGEFKTVKLLLDRGALK